MTPNVRGSDGYGKTWLHADNGPKRLQVITDIEDCARFIRDRWAATAVAPRIGITGASYGGYSTLVGMTMFAGAYDAGVSVVGMSNLTTFLNNTAAYRRPLRITEYGDPAKDGDALRRLSPITYIDQVKAPLLIIQGANDPRVPVSEALQMQAALDRRRAGSRAHPLRRRGPRLPEARQPGPGGRPHARVLPAAPHRSELEQTSVYFCGARFALRVLGLRAGRKPPLASR